MEHEYILLSISTKQINIRGFIMSSNIILDRSSRQQQKTHHPF